MVLDYSPKNKMTTHKSLLMGAVMGRSTSGVEFQATYAGPHPAKQHPGQGAGPGEDMGGGRGPGDARAAVDDPPPTLTHHVSVGGPAAGGTGRPAVFVFRLSENLDKVYF